jgi:hypothetical protein
MSTPEEIVELELVPMPDVDPANRLGWRAAIGLYIGLGGACIAGASIAVESDTVGSTMLVAGCLATLVGMFVSMDAVWKLQDLASGRHSIDQG